MSITKPSVGTSVRITSMPGGMHTGKIGVVTDAYTLISDGQIAVTIDGEPMPHQNDCWVIDGWQEIVTSRFSAAENRALIGRQVRCFGVSDRAYEGRIGRVTAVGSVYGRAEFTSIQKPDDSVNLVFETYEEMSDGQTLTVSDPALAVGDALVSLSHEQVFDANTELLAKVERLERELERANERVSEYGTRAGKWERDFGRYANRVMQEAVDRDWCSEYEQVVDEIRSDLEIAEIPDRRKRTRVRRRIEATTYRDVWVWVDEDDSSTTDPDEWYGEEDDDSALGEDWADEQVRNECDNNGFDNVDYRCI